MNKPSRYLRLYSCCHFIKGANRTLLLDSQRQQYFFVPNAMQIFIDFAHGQELSKALGALEEEDKAVAEEYIDFLLTNELAFYCSSLEEYNSFPAIDTSWDDAASITNAVFEIDDPNNITHILKSISDLYIPCVQLIIHFSIDNLEVFSKQIKMFNDVSNKTLQILFRNHGEFSIGDLLAFSAAHPKIELMIAFGSKENLWQETNNTSIILSTQNDYGSDYCGIVQAAYFNFKLSHYTESLAHNTCLNRKISIDTKGNIKNCPSMKESFGHISNTTLAEAIEKSSFKNYWNITKDQVSVCRDCEFRHICTDCRAYLDNPDDPYSKPLKCGYNPYTCEWEEWSTHPMKRQAIQHYQLNFLNA
ncbi:grasp-with-spasm system SPASM domain peptide maturase [Taibaiella koreensis]|uniref:grasp-with-spasm system SPASM domain peptide maturase n=1 Tax=Taibaiella koreensis TaxID=1268548 RepID=UPI000E59E650|nr:grasp-with-spasm system SPASM domain peptide maturase [Taibaiella koreensis]